jgi:hypothetical protein
MRLSTSIVTETLAQMQRRNVPVINAWIRGQLVLSVLGVCNWRPIDFFKAVCEILRGIQSL